MLTFRDSVKESVSASPGTGSLTLTGAIAGYQTATSAGLDGLTCSWRCEAVNANGVPTGQWEVFDGVFTASGATLTRVTVRDGSDGPAVKVNFTGACNVFLVIDADTARKAAGINDFGDGSMGDASYASGASSGWGSTTGADDTGYVLKQFKSLSITNGSVMTALQRSQVLVILVQGDCTISGAGSQLHMDARGAAATPVSATQFYRSLANLWGEGLPNLFSIPQAGAAGGTTQNTGTVSAGKVGAAGSTVGIGATGGGGSGAGGNAVTVGNGGAGAAGTCFCGGSGGGAGGQPAASSPGVAGAANGGAGGNAGANGAANCGGGGAGNPVGTGTGTGPTAPTGGGGGTLILIVGGNLTIGAGALITARGGNGGNATNAGAGRNMGGGGAGGGSIIILYGGTLSNSGTIDANGGAGGTASGAAVSNSAGGAGGAGSVQGPTKIAS